MKNTKRRFESFSFYDRTGMERHLEKMAEQGWLLEKMSSFGWIYRRIEPQKLCFSITYYPKATEFDPEMSEGQRTLHDFCAHSGWVLAATAASMQVFYNEDTEAVPIETDPQIELQNMHAAVKKTDVFSYCILSGVGILQGAMFIWRLLDNPIGVLSSVSNLFTGMCWCLLLLICIVEMGTYFVWYFKAKKAAEQGEFLETHGHQTFQTVILLVIIFGMAYWFFSLGNRFQRMIGIAAMCYILAVAVIVNAVKNLMKRKKVKAGTNKTLTWITSFVMSFGIMGVISFFLFRAVLSGDYAKMENPKVETYEHRGVTITAYHDELPLEVADLIETDYEKYSTRWQVEESPLVGYFVGTQRPHFDELVSQPGLDYRIVQVKVPILYDVCFEELYHQYIDNRNNSIGPLEERLRYVEIDKEVWQADAAYRVYEGEEAWDRYLICWGNYIVEIRSDWELTEAQKTIIADRILKF